jgi:hypothetical protein
MVGADRGDAGEGLKAKPGKTLTRAGKTYILSKAAGIVGTKVRIIFLKCRLNCVAWHFAN